MTKSCKGLTKFPLKHGNPPCPQMLEMGTRLSKEKIVSLVQFVVLVEALLSHQALHNLLESHVAHQVRLHIDPLLHVNQPPHILP